MVRGLVGYDLTTIKNRSACAIILLVVIIILLEFTAFVFTIGLIVLIEFDLVNLICDFTRFLAEQELTHSQSIFRN